MKAHDDERELHEDEVLRLRIRRVGNELGMSATVRDAITGEVSLVAASVCLGCAVDPEAVARGLWKQMANTVVKPELMAELLRVEMDRELG